MEHDDIGKIRSLRAAIERSRFYQRLAAGGAIVAIACFYYVNSGALRGTPVQQMIRYAGVVIFLASLIPFFLLKCPKCGKRYNGVADLFRNFNSPTPCVSCGFDMDNHLPRYGRPDFSTPTPQERVESNEHTDH